MGGVKTKVTQKTRYPVDGMVELAVEPERPVEFDLRCRDPRLVHELHGVAERPTAGKPARAGAVS